MADTFLQVYAGRVIETERDHRQEFLSKVRHALGHFPVDGASKSPDFQNQILMPEKDLFLLAEKAMDLAKSRSEELFIELESSATKIGWNVTRFGSFKQVSDYVVDISSKLKAESVIRSGHPLLENLDLDQFLADAGIKIDSIFIDNVDDKTFEQRLLRAKAADADIGITGVDYAIAETGSCVLFAKEKVSRLVSLLPPVHVAIVQKGQVLPSLDELFVLQRRDFLQGDELRYMNLISGPSRSADIEQTITTGVHGPGKVYMILLG